MKKKNVTKDSTIIIVMPDGSAHKSIAMDGPADDTCTLCSLQVDSGGPCGIGNMKVYTETCNSIKNHPALPYGVRFEKMAQAPVYTGKLRKGHYYMTRSGRVVHMSHSGSKVTSGTSQLRNGVVTKWTVDDTYTSLSATDVQSSYSLSYHTDKNQPKRYATVATGDYRVLDTNDMTIVAKWCNPKRSNIAYSVVQPKEKVVHAESK